MVEVHPRTLRIYEDEGLLSPARTPSNIRLYSENDIRRILWIRRLTQERGVNLAGVRLLFELEERLGTRILEALFDEERAREAGAAAAAAQTANRGPMDGTTGRPPSADDPEDATQRELTAEPAPRSITRIVATRVAAARTGDTND